jgi:hypothetical protein
MNVRGRAKTSLAAGVVLMAACSPHATKRNVGQGQTTSTAPPVSAVTPTRPLPLPTPPPATVTATTASSTTPPPTAPAPAPPSAPWKPIGPLINGVAALSSALLQGRPGAPFTAVVRINPAVTRPVLYAGTAEPGGNWPNQGSVPAAQLAALVAAFNAGFHTYASAGGWYDHGRTAVPLRPGAASLVIRADGSATVGMWGRDVSLTPEVVSVRQNLGLLVDGSQDRSGTGSWGATLGAVRYTARSGIGIDAAGDLLYSGGPGLDAQSLAHVLIQAGAVRAMELDINPQWVSFSYYTSPGSGSDLLTTMLYGPSHWLSGSARDFIAIFAR